jgi:hypothetical protein
MGIADCNAARAQPYPVEMLQREREAAQARRNGAGAAKPAAKRPHPWRRPEGVRTLVKRAPQAQPPAGWATIAEVAAAAGLHIESVKRRLRRAGDLQRATLRTGRGGKPKSIVRWVDVEQLWPDLAARRRGR